MTFPLSEPGAAAESPPNESGPSAPLANKTKSDPTLRVAVIGAGPGGLASAIFLQRLQGPRVRVDVYEKARELREIGAGITLNRNTWRLLKLLGAAESLGAAWDARTLTPIVDQVHRNGLSGEELLRTYQTPDADQPAKTRIMRAAMQAALVNQVKPDTIHLSKRVTRIDDTHPSEIYLEFADGAGAGARAGPYDLLIGADGIRSVTREHAYPNQKLSYAGKIAYRALVPQSKLAHLPNLPQSSCWWWTPESRLFTVGLDDERFEIAAWLAEDETKGQRVSWGQKVDKHEVLGHYEHYCDEVKAIAEAADEWMEFAMFTGPRLDSVCHQGRMALVGDASHPLSGAFGAGACFAFEDAYIISQAIARADKDGRPLATALADFDAVRAPFYHRLFGMIDGMANNTRDAIKEEPSSDEIVRRIVAQNWRDLQTAWIYDYDVAQEWAKYIGEPHNAVVSGSPLDAEFAQAATLVVAA